MAEALMEGIIEEFLLRLPPDDPVTLVRAATVCRRWCRVISAPGFRRRFAQRHRTPPMLGFISNLRSIDLVRFDPTTPFRPPHITEHRDRCAEDARHGRVLLARFRTLADLEVWDPVTGELWGLPALPVVRSRSCHDWSAAVLCAAHGACDHLDCRRGPFLVILLYSSNGERMRVYVYSSEAGAWSDPIYGPRFLESEVDLGPAALVGNALYFLIKAPETEEIHGILEYDMVTRSMSVIHPPPPPDTPFQIGVLTTKGDSRLGLAWVDRSRLCLWWMETDPRGRVVWTQNESIELSTLLQVHFCCYTISYVRFAHGLGAILMRMPEGCFSIDLTSRQARKEECVDADTFEVIPYMSFYTPDFHQYGVPPVRS